VGRRPALAILVPSARRNRPGRRGRGLARRAPPSARSASTRALLSSLSIPGVSTCTTSFS